MCGLNVERSSAIVVAAEYGILTFFFIHKRGVTLVYTYTILPIAGTHSLNRNSAIKVTALWQFINLVTLVKHLRTIMDDKL